MSSSTITLQSKSDAATALCKLDGQLILNDTCLEELLQDNLYQVICGDHDGLTAFSEGLSQRWNREDIAALRELTNRLSSIVGVYEALLGIDSRLGPPTTPNTIATGALRRPL